MDSQLFTLLRGFFSLIPPKSLGFPSSCSLFAINNFLVDNILLSEHFQTYPPSIQYQKLFWKWAIETMESQTRKCEDQEHGNDFEIDSRIYDHYLSLITPSGPTMWSSSPGVRLQICGLGIPGREAPSHSFITHFWDANPLCNILSFNHDVDVRKFQTATLLESRTTIESGTTGLRTWMASFVLSQYIILNPETVISKRVLELGSGIGFLGIIVATLQHLHRQKDPLFSRSSISLTDVNDEALARCRDNVNLPCNASSRHPNINYLKLDWAESIDDEQYSHIENLVKEKIDPEIIFGADVVFDPSLISPLVGTLKIALQPTWSYNTPKIAIIALTVRNETTVGAFISQVRDSGLNIHDPVVGFEKTSFSETIETHYSSQNVKLFHITAPVI